MLHSRRWSKVIPSQQRPDGLRVLGTPTNLASGLKRPEYDTRQSPPSSIVNAGAIISVEFRSL
jgi:hypothetical protein